VRIWTIAAAVVSLAACTYVLTHGTGQISRPGFNWFYDDQGKSLLEGRWDVSEYSIQGEAFLRDGKRYAYFGFVPALPRIVLNAIFPSMFGRWSRISMWFAVVSLLGAFFAFSRHIAIPDALQPVLLLTLFCGSTVLFLCESDFVYHEAILWSSSFAIWGHYFFGRYLQGQKFLHLAAGALCGFAAFFTRFNTGTGVLICAVWITAILAWRRSFLHAAFLSAFLLAIVGIFVAINHAKFGTYLDSLPFRYHVQYDAARLKKTGETLFHPEYSPGIAANYFDPRHIRFVSYPPYLALSAANDAPSVPFDILEPYAAIPVAVPALLILAILGTAFALRKEGKHYRWCVPLLGSALFPGLSLLVMIAITYRYEHEWYPFFFLGSMLGAASLRSRWAYAALAVAGLWSIAANIGFIVDLSQHPGLFAW
jgi:hypothetical protein